MNFNDLVYFSSLRAGVCVRVLHRYRVDSNPNGIGSYAKYSVSERKAMREKVRPNKLLTHINNLFNT